MPPKKNSNKQNRHGTGSGKQGKVEEQVVGDSQGGHQEQRLAELEGMASAEQEQVEDPLDSRDRHQEKQLPKLEEDMHYEAPYQDDHGRRNFIRTSGDTQPNTCTEYLSWNVGSVIVLCFLLFFNGGLGYCISSLQNELSVVNQKLSEVCICI